MNKIKIVYSSFHSQPSWISVDFDNWRDWEHEEDEGKEEYDRYMDVSEVNVFSRLYPNSAE